MIPAILIPPIFIRPALEHRLANLLIDKNVQQISFKFGHVQVLPADFRKVADGLRSGKLKVTFNPTQLAANGSVAEYDGGTNSFVFESDAVLDDSAGRAAAIHEASHAVADLRTGSTAIRHEEGAAHICEAWYLLNMGSDPTANFSTAVVDAAKAMRKRAEKKRPTRATSGEINSVRRSMMQLGYENAHYSNDGI